MSEKENRENRQNRRAEMEKERENLNRELIEKIQGAHEAHNHIQDNQEQFIHEHMNALADGIFAIAMTIIVLEIAAPRQWSAVPEVTVQIGFFALSFVVLANFYFERSRLMSIITHANIPLITLDFFFLLGICLLPLFTKFMFEYESYNISVVAYGTLIFIVSLISTLMQWLVLKYRLIDSEMMNDAYTSDTAFRIIRREFGRRTVWDIVTIIIAYFSPYFGLGFFVMLPIAQFARRYRVGIYHEKQGLKSPTIYDEILNHWLRQSSRRRRG
ncbi:DUF1211 domain-containing protein [Alloscardovia theropitheci]|uniref:DUF1211 domain-containing protein n=1 Tax=Alloscardovia theropitheci TaxID=2496842 RepID=A0A4R0QRM8_9BIFI|nr:TMEM175 family protein [Alloscardovia theropitheci]TCD53705.1 DUF1211 domain-containing protein [Alloscardovia theropitheci]